MEVTIYGMAPDGGSAYSQEVAEIDVHFMVDDKDQHAVMAYILRTCRRALEDGLRVATLYAATRIQELDFGQPLCDAIMMDAIEMARKVARADREGWSGWYATTRREFDKGPKVVQLVDCHVAFVGMEVPQ